MDKEELAQFNKDTRDSVRGKNNYQPGIPEQGANWPEHQSQDLPVPYWRDENKYE